MPTAPYSASLRPLLHSSESLPARNRAWLVIQRFLSLQPASVGRHGTARSSGGPNSAATKYITAGLSQQSLVRVSAWLQRFYVFLAFNNDLSSPSNVVLPQVRDNDLALDFLAYVADEDKGRSRVQVATRAINFIRRMMKIPPLSDDPRVAMLKAGVLRTHPHAPKGALPFPPVLLFAIADAWGNSTSWWKRMVALLLTVCFLSLLRGAGVLTVPNRTVVWVYDLTESDEPPPPGAQHSGALLLVPARKSAQTAPSWVPVAAGRATVLLAAHVRWRSRHARHNPFLFPSRAPYNYRGRTAWRPNPQNRMSMSSFARLMRLALQEVCGLTKAQADKFTIHSLRVGGINFYKRSSVSIGMRAAIASHKSLATSKLYLRLLPAEQLRELNAIRA